MTWLEEQAIRWLPIGAGLAIGTSARYGLMLSEGRRLTWRSVVADTLMIGLVALVASETADRLGLSGTSAALLSATLAISSDRVIRLVRERFARRVEASLIEDIDRAKGEVRQAVALEISGRNIIDDTMTGRAPEDYVTLRRERLP